MIPMVLAALLTIQSPSPASARGEEAWVLGYSSYVRHACPAWDQRTAAFPPDVLPSPETWNGDWAENGPLATAHRAGVRAAEAGERADKAFCDHPTRGQPARAAALNRALVRRSGRR